MPTDEDREFVEKVKTVGHIQGYKPGKKHATPVINDNDGTVGGQQIEHHDGSVDAVVIPQTVNSRSGVQGKDSD